VQSINSQSVTGPVHSNTISETFPGAGVTIDGIRVAEDDLTAPVMTLDSIKAVGPSTNITMAIIPKGTGAIIAAAPTNTSTGGNARGNYAVDL
jgi:hypothetical protein